MLIAVNTGLVSKESWILQHTIQDYRWVEIMMDKNTRDIIACIYNRIQDHIDIDLSISSLIIFVTIYNAFKQKFHYLNNTNT